LSGSSVSSCSRVKTPADGEVPPTAERSVYIWNRREILAEYDESAGGSLELYKQYFRAAGRLVAVKMYGFHGRREPGPEGFLHTKGGLMYYHSGRFGSPVVITDRHGEPIARYAWDAYGRAMAGVFDPYNTVGFTGKQRDGATGLTYYGARWYDADSGRFMSRDPIKDGWNWYAYVGGDPVNYVDLWGLMATESGENKTDKYEFYVGYTKIDPFNAAQHTTIVEENFETNRERVLVEGFPNRRVGTGEKSSFRWGTLERSEESRPESITTRDTLPIPEGMSSEEFKSNLEEAADSYDGSVPYEAIPELNDESGNSNSLIGSVVREAGSDFTPSRWAPGWNKEVLR